MTGDQHVEIAILIHVDEAEIVGGLAFVKDMPGELSLALVLVPNGMSIRDTAAGRNVDVAILIQIGDGEARADGDLDVIRQLESTFVKFDPTFEILPGTKGAGAQ